MVTLSSQLERLSYTRRDLELIDDEVDRFIRSFIPVIRNTGKANVGRLYLRVIEAILDKSNYAQDMKFRQSVLRTVTELQSAIDIAELVRYQPAGTSSATVDLTATSLVGPAPVGGISIPQYSVITTDTAPVKQYVTLEAYSIPEGATEVVITAVQGVRVVSQTILASTAGEPNEEITLPVARTPHQYIEISVDAVAYARRSDLKDSEPEDLHYYLRDDEDRFTTVIFGDGEYGDQLSPGSVVTATYIQSLGEAGNVPPNTATKVTGTLASQISLSHEEKASGGFDGDLVEDIVRKAPLLASAARGADTDGADFFRASNDRDYEALAVGLVEGVYQALADEGVGSLMNLYIMPAGGGVASSTLLTSVEDTLGPRMIHGSTLNARSLLSAHILLEMKVSLLTNKINKSVARKQIYEAITAFKTDGVTVNPTGALYYRNLTIGRGFALSDMSNLIESVDGGILVDFVDYTVFTRYPTAVPADPATSVEFDGEIIPLPDVGYSDWAITPTSSTEFALSRDGVIDSYGTIGVTHTSSGSEIEFTLGETTDTFDTATDSWIFTTSAYRNNMRLGRFEFMELIRDSDLNISIFYPGELEIGS